MELLDTGEQGRRLKSDLCLEIAANHGIAVQEHVLSGRKPDRRRSGTHGVGSLEYNQRIINIHLRIISVLILNMDNKSRLTDKVSFHSSKYK